MSLFYDGKISITVNRENAKMELSMPNIDLNQTGIHSVYCKYHY